MQELFAGHGWRVTLEEGKFPDGRMKEMACVHRCDSVHIIAVPSAGRVLLLREYRPMRQQWRWLIPGGKMDKEHETDPLLAAQRELQEETGFKAAHMKSLIVVNPAELIIQRNHIFVATDLSPSPLPCDDDELIEVHDLPLNEALQNLFSQEPASLISTFSLLLHQRSLTC
jgi:ADP-ribose pyrophosphatase